MFLVVVRAIGRPAGDSRAVHTNNLHSPARVVVTAVAVSPAGRPQGLSVVNERPQIIRMTTTGRLQHRYDHRLRDLVHATGDVSIATNLGIPRSTARGWLGKAATVVVSVDVTNRTASELQREVLELRRRMKKITQALHHTREARAAFDRLPFWSQGHRLRTMPPRRRWRARCRR